MNSKYLTLDSPVQQDHKTMIIQFPTDALENTIKDSIEWRSYSLNFSRNTIQQEDWVVAIIDIPNGSSCPTWGEKQLITLISNHLSTFVPIYKLPEELPPE